MQAVVFLGLSKDFWCILCFYTFTHKVLLQELLEQEYYKNVITRIPNAG